MSKNAKRGGDCELEESDPKRKKIQIPPNETKTTANFLAGIRIFILQAGIEKTRMRIFKSQLTKFGGCIEENDMSNCTHIIVDDKMELDRFCRISKIDFPPQNIPIIKCSWLSACFKEKSLLCSKMYELDVKNYIESNAEPTDDNTIDKTTDTIKNDAETGESNIDKKEGPKVGVMWRAFEKSENKIVHADSEDSDYNPSGEEEEDDHLVEDTDMPGTSDCSVLPRRPLPVSCCLVLLSRLQYRRYHIF